LASAIDDLEHRPRRRRVKLHASAINKIPPLVMRKTSPVRAARQIVGVQASAVASGCRLIILIPSASTDKFGIKFRDRRRAVIAQVITTGTSMPPP
jgi:hypothetical protein